MNSLSSKKWISAAATIVICALSPIATRAQSIADPIGIHQQPPMAMSRTDVPPPGTVVSLAPQFPQRIIDALDFVDQGKYGDAIDIANELCAESPNSTVAHQLRGTLELWIGDAGRALKDFKAADQQSGDEAVTHLAMAICAMRSTNTIIEESTIPSELHRASTCPDVTDAQKDDLADIEAYFRFIHKDPNALSTITTPSPVPTGEGAGGEGVGVSSSPARAELLALAKMRAGDPAAAADLTRFLTTKSGVPRVREDEGLRMIFTSKPTMLEPTITDPSILAMFNSRLTQPRQRDAAADTAPPIWGTVTLGPQQQNAATTSVLYTVDGAPIATVTNAPYTFEWNTRLVLNGVHTVRLEAHMDGGGIVGREMKTIRVSNPGESIAGTCRDNMDQATYVRIESRIWGLLRPRPSRAVAEMALARLQIKSGDHADADTHNLIATALDPWLTNVMHATVKHLGSADPNAKHLKANDGVWYGNTNRKWVCLTFDDGPNAKTAALLDALDKVHARATFFIVGSRAEQRPDLVRRMAASGHDVENHSYTHPNIAQCLPAMVETEVIRTNIVIRSLTGRYPHFFRPPGGNASHTLAALADAYGLKLAFWSLDVLKAEEESSKPGLVKAVLGHVHPGAIVLMHNGPDVTTQAIGDIVDGLRAKGYQIVTLREIVTK